MLIGNVIIFPMWFIRQNIFGHVILLCRMYIRNYFHKESIWNQSLTCFNDPIYWVCGIFWYWGDVLGSKSHITRFVQAHICDSTHSKMQVSYIQFSRCYLNCVLKIWLNTVGLMDNFYKSYIILRVRFRLRNSAL